MQQQPQQEPGTKPGALPRGGRLLAAAGLASTAALLFLCILNGPTNDAALGSRNLRNDRDLVEFGQITGPLNRVSKVLSHALKPRLGPKKGKDVGGPWVHKALDSDDPIERPTLLDTDTMAGTEEVEPIAIAPAAATDPTQKRADSVLHLGGALRQTQHRSLQAPAPATFGVDRVVPVEQANGGGKADDGDKGLLKHGHKKGHKQGHKKVDEHKTKKNLHGHKTKQAPKKPHGHKHKHKQAVTHMAGKAHQAKKKAVHEIQKAALKGKVQKAKIEKHIEKEAALLHAKAKKAAVHAAQKANKLKHLHKKYLKKKHGHKKHAAKPQPKKHVKPAHDLHKHAHKKMDGHLHLRALQQQQAAQAAVAERLNLSPEDTAALRAIARDAALEVIKDAARDAGYDLDFELPSGAGADDAAAKDEESVMEEGGFFLSRLEEDGEEADMALFDPLDLNLEDVLDVLGTATFADRQQVMNETTTTTTTTTNATGAAKAEAGEADDDAGFLLSALRQMNMTGPEADRLRTRARTAAETALREAAGEAGYTGANLDALITSFAAARGDAPNPATRRQLWGHNGVGGHDAWQADRAQRSSHGGHDDDGYYGVSGDDEADAAWWEGFYDADEASPRSGYSDYHDGTVGRRGYGNRQLHWHHDNNEATAEEEGPWDAWAEEAAQSGYFVDEDAIDDFFA